MIELEQMTYVAKKLLEIRAESSRLAKEQMLRNLASTKGFKEILQFIYNPYIKTGIAKAKLSKVTRYSTENKINYKQAIEYFTNHQTGSDVDIIFAQNFISTQESSYAADLAVCMVTKNLKIGITETTLNNVYGKSFIPVIDLMLGEPYKDYKNKVKGPFIVTEKLDGIRRLLIKRDGKIRFYSRSGIIDEGLMQIEAEAEYLPDNMVYDGELLAIGEFPTSIALRQATNSLSSTKGIKTGLTYNIFDMLRVCEFDTGESFKTSLTRKINLGALFGDTSIRLLTPDFESYIDRSALGFPFKFIKPVPILGVASNEEEILELTRPIWFRKFEGTMLNTFDSTYVLKRTKELLKVKLVEERVVKVVGMTEGEGENVGMLGALLVDYKGSKVGVGIGFDMAQRIRYWKRPENIIGKEIQIETFGESFNKVDGAVSLNVAVFKRIVGEQE